MYLKELGLHGFKSFPEKAILEFNKGVTAVVGPNGSGKSNISDAVRWVLGEQRVKNLRGDKMEDVIFAGTDSRKPIGFAEVSLTLDNEDGKIPVDYSEITVKRTVFRSGESKYTINGTPCRLKDINELFMFGSSIQTNSFGCTRKKSVTDGLMKEPFPCRLTIYPSSCNSFKARLAVMRVVENFTAS